MGEVSEMLDVNPSLLRFWEKKFDILKPKKNKKGNRMFTPEDVKNLKIIYHLVKESGMTLAGAQQRIKQSRKDIERDMEISERLHAIKSMLLEIKQQIGDDNTVNSEGKQIIVDTCGQEADFTDSAEPVSEATVPENTESINEVSEDDADTLISQFDNDTYTPEELLEQEIEMAFSASDGQMIFDAAAIEESDCRDDSAAEINAEEIGESESPSSPQYMASADKTEVCDNEQSEEPETVTVFEEGMLFAVQTVKPKPIVPDSEEEPGKPDEETSQRQTGAKNDIANAEWQDISEDKPHIIEQTLF